MGVFDMFKWENGHAVDNPGSREQLNMWVRGHVKRELKNLGMEFNVNRDIVGEHALDIGIHQLKAMASDTEKASIVRRHLIDDHVHGTGGYDSEPIVRLGEGNGDIARLLAMIEPLVREYEALEWALPTAKRTGNYQPALRLGREFERKAELFVDWARKEFFK